MHSQSAVAVVDFTVVIPTYNGAQRVSAVLERLRSQIVPKHLRWEIIVVDNNSQDATAAMVQQWQADWDSPTGLHYVFEARQGLAFARQCGVDHAKGALVGFLDDDNWPQPNWVAAAVTFGQSHPQAGAYGSRIQGLFETPPEAAVKPLLRFLAIRDHGDQPQQFQVERVQLPPGAGLVVSKAAWVACIPPQLTNITRAGDDYEISIRMAHQGWEIWYCPAMEIGHFIPASRLTRDYLLRLTHLYGLRTCSLVMLQTPSWQRPLVLAKSFLGSLRRIMLHHLQPRESFSSQLEADCQLAFHVGNLKSPFDYLVRSFR